MDYYFWIDVCNVFDFNHCSDNVFVFCSDQPKAGHKLIFMFRKFTVIF